MRLAGGRAAAGGSRGPGRRAGFAGAAGAGPRGLGQEHDILAEGKSCCAFEPINFYHRNFDNDYAAVCVLQGRIQDMQQFWRSFEQKASLCLSYYATPLLLSQCAEHFARAQPEMSGLPGERAV